MPTDSDVRRLRAGKLDKPLNTASNGDTLIYNSTSELWEAQAPPNTGGYSLGAYAATATALTDGQTIYWGGLSGVVPGTTGGIQRIYIPKDGTIRSVYAWAYAGTVGTNEAWSCSIRLNNSSDTLVQSLSSTVVS